MPTLVLAGRYCFLFPPEHQAILADRLPNARLELIECAGHNPQMEQTDVTMGIIRSFLAEGIPARAERQFTWSREADRRWNEAVNNPKHEIL